MRFAIVGFGLSGRYFHAPIVATTPGAVLSVIVSSKDHDAVRAELPFVKDPAQVTILASFEALMAAGRDVCDAVVVASPNTLHAAQTEACIAKGLHVVVEKPVAVTSAAALKLADAADAAAVVCSAYHNRRFDSDFTLVRRLLADGRIGDVHRFETRWFNFRPAPRDRWREHNLPGSGSLFDLGPHLIDQCLVLFGVPDAVAAELEQQRPGAQTTDAFSLRLRYRGRGAAAVKRTCVLEAGSLVVDGAIPRYTIHGTRGSIVKRGMDVQEAALRSGAWPETALGDDTEQAWGVEPADDGEGHRARVTTVDGDNVPSSELVPAGAGDYRGFYAQFCAAASAAAGASVEPPSSVRSTVDVLRVIEAAIESHENGNGGFVPLALEE